jgi:thymidine kinase
MNGHLEVIFGGMYAGKSEELIRRLRRAEIANKKAMVFKPKIDNRYDENDVVSHSGLKAEAFPVNFSGDIMAIFEHSPAPIDIVAIDEAQFFDENLLFVINKFIIIGVDVICAGLNQDFRGQGFGLMPELIARADETYHLFAVCQKCGEKATKTQRILDGKPAPLSSETVIVGGQEQYEARCEKCWEAG